MVSILPVASIQFCDSAGLPLAGGSVAYYIPSTLTAKTTYSEPTGTTPNTNPVVLDSGGRCIVYGSGQYRMIVKDSLGNTVYDQVTNGCDYGITLLTLGVTAAMIPVVQATTLAAAGLLLTASLTHLNLGASDQTLTVTPTANTPSTLASVNIQGPALSANGREFLVNLGMTSAIGLGGAAINDKVTLYAGMKGNAGTSNIWALNTVTEMGSGSGAGYIAQSIECDFNNNESNRSIGIMTGGLGVGKPAYGMSISGASSFRSTAGLLISGGTLQWNAGLLFANDCIREAAIIDYSQSPTSFQIGGTHANGLQTTYATITGAAVFMGNQQAVAWQTYGGGSTVSDTLDSNNSRIVGNGATTIQLKVETSVPTLRFATSASITWPKVGGSGGAYIFDTCDASNNRNLGYNATQIILGAPIVPLTVGQIQGTTTSYYGGIYSNIGIVAPSDVSLKTDIKPLKSMLSIVNKIKPISFKWRETDKFDDHTHFGFDAEEVKKVFDKLEDSHTVVKEQDNGQHWMVKDQLMAVMFQSIRELSAEIEKLKKGESN